MHVEKSVADGAFGSLEDASRDVDPEVVAEDLVSDERFFWVEESVALREVVAGDSLAFSVL